jgi:tetratricopeptide (TPR) repeat protein
MAEELPDQQGEARALSYLGDVSSSEGDYEGAIKLYKNSIRIFWDLRDRLNTAESFLNLAKLFETVSSTPEAILLYGAAHHHLRFLKSPHFKEAKKALSRLQREMQKQRFAKLLKHATITALGKLVEWILSPEVDQAFHNALAISKMAS